MATVVNPGGGVGGGKEKLQLRTVSPFVTAHTFCASTIFLRGLRLRGKRRS